MNNLERAEHLLSSHDSVSAMRGIGLILLEIAKNLCAKPVPVAPNPSTISPWGYPFNGVPWWQQTRNSIGGGINGIHPPTFGDGDASTPGPNFQKQAS